MATYTFFPHLRGGACLTFTAVSLADDATALGYAALVLAEHPSAAEVVVWEGERRVGGHARITQTTLRTPPTGRILVVEDSYFQAEELRCAFHDAGYDDVSCSGAETKALANLDGQRPVPAIVDIDLGEGPSFKVAEALERRGVPFLSVTAYDHDILPPRWRHVGHLLKPISSLRIVQASRALLNGTHL